MGEGHEGPSSSCASAGVHVIGSIQDVEQGSTRVAGIKWMMSRRFAAWTRRQSHESHAGLVTLARYEKSLDGTGECREHRLTRSQVGGAMGLITNIDERIIQRFEETGAVVLIIVKMDKGTAR
jgi:hypothetical protein